MANTFKSYTGNFGNTTDFTYTVPASTTTVILGLNIACAAGTDITTRSSLTDASNANLQSFIGYDIVVPTGGAVQVVSGKIIAETGDTITVSASTAATANDGYAILSVMEIS